MWRDGFLQSGPPPCLLTGEMYGMAGEGLLKPGAGKEPVAGARGFPIRAQQAEERGREHYVAIFAAFALVNPDDHALTINVGEFQMDRFADPQPRRIADGEDGALLQGAHGLQKTRDFLLAQHDG